MGEIIIMRNNTRIVFYKSGYNKWDGENNQSEAILQPSESQLTDVAKFGSFIPKEQLSG